MVAEYDRQRLKHETAAAEDRLKAAILSCPVWTAVVELGLAQRREIARWREAGSVGPSPLPSGANRLDVEHLAAVADHLANDQMEDELDARAAARTAAGDGPS